MAPEPGNAETRSQGASWLRGETRGHNQRIDSQSGAGSPTWADTKRPWRAGPSHRHSPHAGEPDPCHREQKPGPPFPCPPSAPGPTACETRWWVRPTRHPPTRNAASPTSPPPPCPGVTVTDPRQLIVKGPRASEVASSVFSAVIQGCVRRTSRARRCMRCPSAQEGPRHYPQPLLLVASQRRSARVGCGRQLASTFIVAPSRRLRVPSGGGGLCSREAAGIRSLPTL